MIKKGYTLTECLIALAIVAVLSAILLPMASKLRPDGNKVKYLKVYDSIAEAVLNIQGTRLYPREDFEKHIDYTNNIFTNFSQQSNKAGVAIGDSDNGSKKLCQALELAFMGETDDGSKCSNNYNANLDAVSALSDPTFVATNGTSFYIQTLHNHPNESPTTSGDGQYRTEIYFDINGDKEPNQVGEDIFQVNVLANGKVYPADEKGASYLSTRQNWMKRSFVGTNNFTADDNYKLKCFAHYYPNRERCSTCQEMEMEENGEECKTCAQLGKHEFGKGTPDFRCRTCEEEQKIDFEGECIDNCSQVDGVEVNNGDKVTCKQCSKEGKYYNSEKKTCCKMAIETKYTLIGAYGVKLRTSSNNDFKIDYVQKYQAEGKNGGRPVSSYNLGTFKSNCASIAREIFPNNFVGLEGDPPYTAIPTNVEECD